MSRKTSATNALRTLSPRVRHSLPRIILVETWTLLRFRIHRVAAETFWDGLRSGVARLECVGSADLQAAWTMGHDFNDQDFSLVDRTSFAVMERLGLRRAASFDADFSVYRFGRIRSKAFEVVR